MIIIKIIIILSQIISQGDLTHLNSLDGTWTVGNNCDEGRYIEGNIYGDLILKGDCYIWNASLTVYGEVIYNGYSISLGCESSELILENPLTVNSEEISKIRIYPNPTTGRLHTNYRGDIRIFDLSGRLLSTKLDLTSYPSGLYLIQLSNLKIIKIVKY